MHDAPLPDLVLYGRPGCHLCEETRGLLTSMLDDRARTGRPSARLVDRDIETDPAWKQQFSTTIPVVELGGRRLELVTSAGRLRRLLNDVLGA